MCPDVGVKSLLHYFAIRIERGARPAFLAAVVSPATIGDGRNRPKAREHANSERTRPKAQRHQHQGIFAPGRNFQRQARSTNRKTKHPAKSRKQPKARKPEIQQKRGRTQNTSKIKGFHPYPKFLETSPRPTNAKSGTPKTPKTDKS